MIRPGELNKKWGTPETEELSIDREITKDSEYYVGVNIHY